MKNFFEITEIKEKSTFDDNFGIMQNNLSNGDYPQRISDIKIGHYVKYYLKSTTIESFQPFIFKIVEIHEYGGEIDNIVISNGINTYNVKPHEITILDKETLKKSVKQEIKKLNYLFKDNIDIMDLFYKTL